MNQANVNPKIPTNLLPRVVFLNYMLKNKIYSVSATSPEHYRLRSFAKKLNREGILGFKKQGEHFTYHIKPEKRNDLVNYIQEKCHVKEYIEPELLNLS